MNASQQTQGRPTLGQVIAAELKSEATATRKMLERFPAGKADWSPHEKSMTIGKLANHISDVTGWIDIIVNQEELDFATSDYEVPENDTGAKLAEHFDTQIEKSLDVLQNVSDEDLLKTWSLRNGDEIIMEMPRIAFLRGMVMSHLIHHRGQYSVYLRLKDVPLPSIYGPSADEQ